MGFPSGNLDLIKMPYLIFCTAHISNYKKGLQLFFYIIITTSLDLCIIRKGAIMRIFAITVCVEKIYTLKPWYNEPRNSEFLEIVNKTQLPFWGFTKHITFAIVNYLIQWTKRIWRTCSLYWGLSFYREKEAELLHYV